MRNISKIKCKICKEIFSSVGISTHLKIKHSLSIDEYVKSYGEFRKKYIQYLSRDKNFECKICNEKLPSERYLTYHLKLKHDINKVDYIKTHIFSGTEQLCKCGCGEKVKIKEQFPYRVDFIPGHNSNGEFNIMYGKSHTIETRHKMKKSAKNRVKEYKDNNKILPMHSPDAIKRRGEIQSNKSIILKSEKYNVSLLNSLQERKLGIFKFKCNKCSEIYTQYHSSYFICNKCHPRIRSKEETDLYDYIKDVLKISTIKNCRKLADGKCEIDIYCPDYNVGIEYNGLYYHSELSGNKHKKYHIDKTNTFLNTGVKIYQIFSDEWLFKNEIVKGKLKHIFKLNNKNVSDIKKVYARNCIIKEISKKESDLFLEKNHIQGKDISKIKLGCFYKNELMGVMTFGKPRVTQGYKNVKRGVYELIRFATDMNYICVGVAGKTLKYFIDNFQPTKIISYADIRWTPDFKDNLYTKLGFEFIGKTMPNYWYLDKYTHRLYRFKFNKAHLVRQGHKKTLSEWEIMKSLNFDRIWDCGSYKYEMNF